MKKNRLTKKAWAGMIVGAAMLTALPVCAVENEEKDMPVEYSQDTTYTLSIPQSITLSATDSKQAASIGVSAVNTTPTEKVQVTIKSGITNHQVELSRENDDSTKVVSTVTDYQGSEVSNETVVAEFQDMSMTPAAGADTNVLNFSKVVDGEDSQNTVKAGSYSGTIVFEAKVVDR